MTVEISVLGHFQPSIIAIKDANGEFYPRSTYLFLRELLNEIVCAFYLLHRGKPRMFFKNVAIVVILV